MSMNEKNKTLIEEWLTQAGAAPEITDEMLELDGYRITTDSELEDEEFLFRMNGCPCLPRRDLTTITGQAKSGKTICVSMLMACGGASGVSFGCGISIERVRQEPLRVMWIDTEQSQQSTQQILKQRVARIGGETPFPEERFFVFNLRAVLVEARSNLLATAVNAYRPDLVIIDNLRDFVTDINDGRQAQELVEGLMKMAEANRCNIVTVIHQNRSNDNRGVRGWLGTELMNKSYEMYTCQKLMGKPGEKPTFSIEQSLTRKFDISMPLYYQMTDEGLPNGCEPPCILQRDAQGKYRSMAKADVDTLNRDYIIEHPDDTNCPWEWDLRRLFADALGNRASVGYQQLEDTVMELSHIRSKNYYEKLFSMAEGEKIVRKDRDRCGRIVVIPLRL